MPRTFCPQVVVDGEILGTTPVTARVQPASLKVLVPRPNPEAGGAAAGAAAEASTGSPAARGAASAAAAGAARATTAAGIEGSRAAEPSFEALDKQ